MKTEKETKALSQSSIQSAEHNSPSTIPKRGASLEMETSSSQVNLPFHEVYQIGEKIGEGGFGAVHNTYHVTNPKEKLAVKILRRTCREDEQKVWREVSILNRLRNVPNVVRLVDFYIEEEEMYFVQDLAEGGDLLDHIHLMYSKGIETYTEKAARDFALFLFNTIDAIHKCGVVHRDLKPENLLLKNQNDDSELLLCDFGIARILPANGKSVLSDFAGTIPYMAPEILDSNKNVLHGKPVDMWSAGCILYLLLGGYLPFGQDESPLMVDDIKNGRFDFDDENWRSVSHEAKDLICNLLQVNPNRRWTAAEALKSNWLTNVCEKTLKNTDLSNSVEKLREYTARRRFKAAFHVIRLSNRWNNKKVWTPVCNKCFTTKHATMKNSKECQGDGKESSKAGLNLSKVDSFKSSNARQSAKLKNSRVANHTKKKREKLSAFELPKKSTEKTPRAA